MDVLSGPGKPPALSSTDVMGDFPIKPWEEGVCRERGGRAISCVVAVSVVVI